MIALAALIVGTLATPGFSSPTEMPASWRADLGIPVAVDDGYVSLYGDTLPAGGGMWRNSVTIEGVPYPAIADAGDRWYWPTDAVQLDDGRLLVVALEMYEGGYLGYEVADADAFVVSEPANPTAWRWATKIEDGPWGGRQVQFSDQWPMAFVRDPYGFGTTAYWFDPANLLADWQVAAERLPDSHGVFAPVQTGDGWYGYTWEMWHTATLWRADELTGPWEPVEQITTPIRTYDHGLNVIDGQVWHRWSNGEGDQRVHYETVDL